MTQSQNRSKFAASSGPHTVADLLGHRVASVADAQLAAVGEAGSIHRIDAASSVRKSAMSAPAASKHRSTSWGIVSTVGPVSNR